ncbi:class I adenylate-forming enzyme family protein [Yoonia sp. 208BN28-4]|uniref:class I adenylate-forming enzyme family protein n=1 Tax=Yoonia sp. 208BN28-4 TaxID=3126505 RepID=UPI0030AAF384
MNTPPETIPDPFNMAAYVLAAGQANPDKLALRVVGAVSDDWSYARLIAAVGGTASGLTQCGLSSGDTILIRMGNTADFPIVYLAAIWMGAIPVPLSPQLTAVEVGKIIAETNANMIASDPALPLPDTHKTVVARDALRAMPTNPAVPPVMGDPDRPAYMVYTSGTSGKSRGVVHAHRAIWARRMMWDGWYGLRASDVMLHAGAFNWTYTMGTGLMDPWAIGATALIPDASVTPDQLPALMADHHATIFAAAPGVYRRLLRHDMPDLPHLRHGLCAGEKLPDAVRQSWQDATGTQVHEAFGMSECSTFLSGSPAKPAPHGTLGFPQTGRNVAILDPDGQEILNGERGTIAIHRCDPGLMLGYHNAADETAQKYSGDWFLTGDMGHRTSDGAIVYEGRDDDMMNAGGVRVSPLEIEATLTAHPSIDEVACCAVRVRTDVYVIAAFYTAANLIDPDELRRFAAVSLAGYKVPRIFRHVADIPKGANNKMLRRKLRDDWSKADSAPQRRDPDGQA